MNAVKNTKIQYGSRIQVRVQEEKKRDNEGVSGPSLRNDPPAHIRITAVAARDPGTLSFLLQSFLQVQPCRSCPRATWFRERLTGR
jgi:hypothetical protein